MKNLTHALSVLVVVALSMGFMESYAQVTINSSTIITPGFDQKLDRDINTVLIEESVTPGDIFDFSGLNPVTKNVVNYKDASAGDNADQFPSATILLESISEERYMRHDDNGLYFVGLAFNNTPGGFPEIVLKSDSELPVHEVPLNYGDMTNSEARFSSTFSADVLPDSLKDQIGVPVDSFRVSLVNEREMEAVNYGTLQLPENGTYEIVKVLERLEVELAFEVKVPFVGWVDITPVVIGAFPEIGTFFAGGPIVTYSYYTNDVQGPILTYQSAGGDTISNFQFRNDLSTSIKNDYTLYSMSISPNPSTVSQSQVVIHTSYAGAGFIDVYDMQGSKVMESTSFYEFNGGNNHIINTNSLNSGLYLVILKDEKGNILSKEKLVLTRR